ncbi:MAG: hypothetical protein L6R42_011221, partial [Xanthoria sp. 1 TBL-2021]
SPAFDFHRESKRRITARVGRMIKTTAEPTTWDERSSLDIMGKLAFMIDDLIEINENNEENEVALQHVTLRTPGQVPIA